MIEDLHFKEDTIRTFIQFVQTARSVLKYTDTYLYRKARFSTIKLITLEALANDDGVMTCTDIAERTHTERHNVTTLIERLAKDGLVTADRDSSDKRCVNITLTGKGRDVLMQVVPFAGDIAKREMSSISKGDVIRLQKLLRVLRQNAYDGLDDLAKRP